jgi:putative flippase GtrA
MLKVKEEYYSKTFLKFLLAGGLAAIVNIASRVLYNIKLSYIFSIILAYLTGMLTAFLLNRYFVFNAYHGLIKRQMIFFILVNLFAVAQTIFISLLIARWLLPAFGLYEHAELFAHMAGVTVPVFTSFLGHKYFSFPSNSLKI